MSYELPHAPSSSGYALIVYCCAVMTVCFFLAINPVKFFRILRLGRPLPKFIEKPWVKNAYRICGIVIFFVLLRILIEAIRP